MTGAFFRRIAPQLVILIVVLLLRLVIVLFLVLNRRNRSLWLLNLYDDFYGLRRRWPGLGLVLGPFRPSCAVSVVIP